MTALAHFAFLWRRRILLGAVLVAGLAAWASSSVFDVVKPYGFEDPDSESSRAVDLLEAETGERPLPDVVLLVEPGSPVDAGPGREAVGAVGAELRAVPEVVRVRTPVTNDPRLISADGEGALVLGWVEASNEDIADLGETIKHRFEEDPAVTAGGPAVTAYELNEASEEDLQEIERYAAPVLLLLSLLVFRGMVAAVLPLAIGALSILLTLAVLRALTNVMEIDSFAINIVTGLGLGLAIDYSLFIVTRYREEIEKRGPTGEALRETLGSAGRMVTFSGIIVAAALISLCVFPQRFLYSTGVGAALVAIFSVLVCLVVLSALLAVLGNRVNALAPRRLEADSSTKRWYQFGRRVLRYPVPIVTVIAAVMIIAGLPILRVELTRSDASDLPSDFSARQVSDSVRTEFPSDPSSRIIVAITPEDGDEARKAAASAVRTDPNVGAVVPVPAGDLKRLDVELEVDPFSDNAVDLVDRIRDEDWGGEALAGGPPAELTDQRESLADHLPWAVGIVVLSTLLVLFALTRSVVLPLVALLMNLLTISVAFGVLVLVFQDGRFEEALGFTSRGAIDSSVPILLFAVVFGLSTDYGVFLLHCIGEARRGSALDEQAIAMGLARSGRSITMAALLFAAAIGAFAWSDLLSIKEVAVGTAVAVIVDATLVRALLLPALLRLLGPVAWWRPRWLLPARTSR